MIEMTHAELQDAIHNAKKMADQTASDSPAHSATYEHLKDLLKIQAARAAFVDKPDSQYWPRQR